MPFVAPVKSGEAPPTGTKNAVLYGLVDLGLQPGYTKDPAKPAAPVPKWVLLFEIGDRRKEGESAGERFVVSCIVSASMSKKSKVRGFVEGILGKSISDAEASTFDVETLVGRPCTLSLKEKERPGGGTWTEIAAVTAPMEGMTALIPEHSRLEIPTWVVEMAAAHL